jgi:tetratricopeptide (TPR) repeat protein
VIRHSEAVLRLDPRSAHARELAAQARQALSKLGGLMGAGPEGDAYLERALEMYDRWRTLVDDLTDQHNAAQDRASSYGNSAELMMALGRLDDAIDWYRRAIEIHPTREELHHFGLGVAYDRDGQWSKARAEMRIAFEQAGRSLEVLSQPNVFFVPLGDVYYYLGLMHQILGNREVAIANYNRFLTLSPNNRYQERAREHLEELTKGAPRP